MIPALPVCVAFVCISLFKYEQDFKLLMDWKENKYTKSLAEAFPELICNIDAVDKLVNADIDLLNGYGNKYYRSEINLHLVWDFVHSFRDFKMRLHEAGLTQREFYEMIEVEW